MKRPNKNRSEMRKCKIQLTREKGKKMQMRSEKGTGGKGEMSGEGKKKWQNCIKGWQKIVRK